MKSILSRIFGMLCTIGLLSSAARASGYEVPVIWSGKHGGMANAVVGLVEGAEALFFNPAGLVTPSQLEATLNASGAITQVRAPVTSNNESRISKRAFTPFGGVFGVYKLHERVGLGIGAYTAAGSGGDFGDVDFGFPNNARISGYAVSNEVSLGVAVKLTDCFTLGAAWRASILMSENYAAAAGFSSSVTDLSGSNFTGARAGLQYRSTSRNWGAGLMFRSAVPWKFEHGHHTIQSLATVPVATVAESEDATLETSFPWAAAVGGYYRLSDKWLGALQYTFVNYKALRETVTTSSALNRLGFPNGTQVFAQAWNNSHGVQAGAQYSGFEKLALKAGYAIVSQVIPSNRALYSLPPPGISHTITAGASYALSEHFEIDGAIDVTFGSGPRDTDGLFFGGEQSNKRLAVHNGLTYRM